MMAIKIGYIELQIDNESYANGMQLVICNRIPEHFRLVLSNDTVVDMGARTQIMIDTS